MCPESRGAGARPATQASRSALPNRVMSPPLVARNSAPSSTPKSGMLGMILAWWWRRNRSSNSASISGMRWSRAIHLRGQLGDPDSGDRLPGHDRVLRLRRLDRGDFSKPCSAGWPPTPSPMATAAQGDLETRLADEETTHHGAVGNFVLGPHAEADQPGLPRRRWADPSGVIDTRPAGTTPAGCSTTTPSTPRIASPGYSCCSTPNGPAPSADSPSIMSRNRNRSYASGSAMNPSSSPNPSPRSLVHGRRRPPRSRHHR